MQPGAGLRRVNGLTAIKGCEAAPKLTVELGQLNGASGVVFLQKPERFTDDFTRRVVAARIDFGADLFFKLRGKRHIHGEVLSSTTLAAIAKIVNVCY